MFYSIMQVRKAGGFMKITMISSNELDSWIEQKECMLVDVRKPSQYRESHINGAVNMPYEKIDTMLSRLPKNIPVIFYCERGSSSLDVCKKACRLGIYGITVVGGINGYKGKYRVKNRS